MYDVIMKAFGQTVYMVIGSTIFSVILGFIPAIVLTVTSLWCRKLLFLRFLLFASAAFSLPLIKRCNPYD